MPETARIPFVKASAYGNDFLIVSSEFQGDDPAVRTRQLCDRHHGVGADGVEWLSEDPEHVARISLINADGSFAELSGNGTRCVAAYLASLGKGKELRIATDAGPRLCRLTRHRGHFYEFLTEMGSPQVGEPFEVDLGMARQRGVPVSIGNPHFVIFVEELPERWREQSQAIQALTQCFPEGINVEWVQVEAPGAIAIHIYERGAGETQSSGTGSSASAAAAIATRNCDHSLAVASPGGAQRVEWTPGGPLLLEGAASLICSGEFFL
jgi:diaminopimelate epimerase